MKNPNKNKILIMQHRRGLHFFRWLWLSTNLFVTVKFHDIEKEIKSLPGEGGVIFLKPGLYVRPIEIIRSNVILASGNKASLEVLRHSRFIDPSSIKFLEGDQCKGGYDQ